MDTHRWQKIEQLFNEVLALPLDEREPFLVTACSDDRRLRSEVDSLLSEVDQPSQLLSQPAFTLGARLLAHDSIEALSGKTLAAYTIIRHLGSGGMGDVFLAEDPRLERLVALKLLPASLTGNAESVLRLQQEARAASAISHPHIAHIYECGEVDDSCYLTMEYVEGKTLRELLKEKAIDFQQALDFALQVGQALQAAHEAGVVHRDIKPENIMVRRTDSTTPWKIALLPTTGGPPIKTLGIPYAVNQIIRWSADSKALLYLDSPKGVSNVWRLALSGEKAESLTKFSAESIFGYQFSADGSQLVSARGTITRQVILFTNPG
jgi:serine/threonine protein kinase